jgi:hypothetical protein
MAIIKRITKDNASPSVIIQIIDSVTGLPETAVEYNTGGIDLWYRRDGAAKVSITEAALTALTDAWSSGGIEHISNGAYRLDLPEAAVDTGVNAVEVGGTITDMIVIGGTVELVDAGILDPTEILFIDFGGVPQKVINPKTSTDTFILEIAVRDHNNELIAPDTFTLTLVDQDAADVSARIDDTTPTAVATGRYQVTYTSNTSHAAGQLTLGATAVKSGYVGGIGKTTIMLERRPLAMGEDMTFTNTNTLADEIVAVT